MLLQQYPRKKDGWLQVSGLQVTIRVVEQGLGDVAWTEDSPSSFGRLRNLLILQRFKGAAGRQ